MTNTVSAAVRVKGEEEGGDESQNLYCHEERSKN